MYVLLPSPADETSEEYIHTAPAGHLYPPAAKVARSKQLSLLLGHDSGVAIPVPAAIMQTLSHVPAVAPVQQGKGVPAAVQTALVRVPHVPVPLPVQHEKGLPDFVQAALPTPW